MYDASEELHFSLISNLNAPPLDDDSLFLLVRVKACGIQLWRQDTTPFSELQVSALFPPMCLAVFNLSWYTTWLLRNNMHA